MNPYREMRSIKTLIFGVRMEILFVVLFAYLRKVKSNKLQKAAEAAAARAKQVMPLVTK